MKNHRLFFILGLTLCRLGFAEQNTATIEERVALKRIVEYWKEEEFSTVETQIASFFQKYPHSSYSDTLLAMLGDLYFHKNNHAKALQAYQRIEQEGFLNETEFNRLCCLYKLELFSDAATCAEHFLSRRDKPQEKENLALFLLSDSFFQLGKKATDPAEKSLFYQKALPHFERLAKTNFKEQSLYPLSEIYVDLKEWKNAVSVFEALAASHPQEKENLLFQVAAMQLNMDKKEAVDTYRTIYLLKGPHSALAACNRIQLLFELKRYKDLLLSYEESLKYIPLENLNTIRYYVGSSLVALKDYRLASAHLSQFVESKEQNADLLRSAFHSLAFCAKELNDQGLFEKSFNGLVENFPESRETALVLLMDIELAKERKQLDHAERSLSLLIDRFPNHPDLENFLYERGSLLCQLEKWDLAVDAFNQFLDAYPSTSKKSQIFSQLIYSKMRQVAQALPEMSQARRQDLVETLAAALKEDNFKGEERKKIQFFLGKTLYEMGRYKEAIDEFNTYVARFPDDPSCTQVYDMLASAYEKEKQTASFVECAEKVCLASNAPEMIEISKSGIIALHQKLYNIYLSRAQEAEEKEKPEFLELAADHLFATLDRAKNENCRWLASYYSERFEHKHEEQDLNRAIIALEHLIKMHGTSPSKRLEVEAEEIKLSSLYVEANRFSDAVLLLSDLNKQYKLHPDCHWKYRRLAQFELGHTYEKMGDAAEACRVYAELIQTASHSKSYFALGALLHKVKLEYAQQKSKDAQEIFDCLKDLEVQRRLATEPWHLEAALTYIDLKVEAAPEKEKATLFSSLLARMEENFSLEKYLAPKDKLPKQFAIYNQYMQFLTLEKLRLKALNEDPSLRKALLEEVQEGYRSLLKLPIHELLKVRIAKRMEESVIS